MVNLVCIDYIKWDKKYFSNDYLCESLLFELKCIVIL